MNKFSTERRVSANRCRMLLTILAIALSVAACTRQPDELSPEGKDAVAVSAVGHLGSNVGISEYYINDNYFGNVPGWGGGGKFSCCVLVPSKVTKPVAIRVRWKTCDISEMKFENGKQVDLNEECKLEEHEAAVPVHFADETGATLYVHFLPGDRVEAWVSGLNPMHVDYAGPGIPRGPAPFYKPKADQSAATPSDK